jgi:hypothetical protein
MVNLGPLIGYASVLLATSCLICLLWRCGGLGGKLGVLLFVSYFATLIVDHLHYFDLNRNGHITFVEVLRLLDILVK